MASTERAPRVHVVCPNPALDHLQLVAELHHSRVNRTTAVESHAGGKGMIVARGLRRLGTEVTLHGFAGGPAGQVMRQACRDLDIRDGHVEIAGSTRITTVIVEASGDSTVVNEAGPDIEADHVAALLDQLEQAVAAADIVVATGSLPPGAGDDLHARVVELARRVGARSIVDSHSAALRQAAAAGPWMIAPNHTELGTLLGRQLPPDDVAALLEGMAQVRRLGPEAVAVTLGKHGVAWADEVGTIRAASPVVTVQNATGSGDMFLAGLVDGVARGLSIDDALVRGVAAGAANAERLSPDIDPARVTALAAACRTEPMVATETGSPA